MIPWIIWLYNKDEDQFLDQHGKNVLNFQLTYLMAMFVILVAGLGMAFAMGINLFSETDHVSFLGLSAIALLIIALVIFVVFYFVIFTIAAIKAYKKKYFNLPLKFKFIK